MKPSAILAAVALCLFSPPARAERTATSADVRAAVYGEPAMGARFTVTGTVTYVRTADEQPNTVLCIEDAHGGIDLRGRTALLGGLAPGDEITADVRISRAGSSGKAYAKVVSAVKTGRSEPRTPPEVDIEDLLLGLYDCRLVAVRCRLLNASVSELCPSWALLVAQSKGLKFYASMPLHGPEAFSFDNLVERAVTLTGVCVPHDLSQRMQMGRMLKLSGTSAIALDTEEERPLEPLPMIGSLRELRPNQFEALGRHRARGRVLAVWHGRRALIRTDAGELAGIQFADGALPECGIDIEAVGFPESDLFRINLTSATWSRIDNAAHPPEPASPATASSITSVANGHRMFRPEMHGRALSMTGKVINRRDYDGAFLMESPDGIVTVDASALNGVELPQMGSTVCVSGICILLTTPVGTTASFPRIEGFLLVPRTGSDLHVISGPPWWTFGRLLAITGFLVLALAAMFAWSISLRRIAERKGRELFRERIAHVSAELKFQERTRLAVELHDSLSQDLVGAAMEIGTAEQLVDKPEAVRHLQIASRAIKASRDELRNCLWDLRSKALEESDINVAIRKTLAPYVSNTEIDVDCRIRRRILSDRAAHMLIRIVRELTLNAIRHGGATRIAISGTLEGGRLCLTVSDNGSGFDPAAAPGIAEGHFGLLGVREQLRLADGSIEIDSRPGAGARISVSFNPSIHDGKESPA